MKNCLLFFLLLIFTPALHAQDAELYHSALLLKSESKLEESLSIFRQLLKKDSSSVDYLWNTCFILCRLGNRQTGYAARLKFFHEAEYLARKAVGVDAHNANAHYAYALALARINEFASNKQKISNAKLLKNECDLALRLDPKHAGAYHILGRWHRAVAGFNFMEKAMINAFFGGVPQGGSYKDAIDCLSKAVLLEPGYIYHKYELAVTYYERDEKDDDILCKIWCKKVLEMKPRDVDDVGTQEKAKVLLKKVE